MRTNKDHEKLLGLACSHYDAAVKLRTGRINGDRKFGEAVAIYQFPFPSVMPIGLSGDITQPALSLLVLNWGSKLATVGV